MRSPCAALLAGCLALFAGCRDGQAPAGGTFAVRDSAGIEIVESATPAWDGDGWSVSGTPSLVIGQMQGDERYLFGEVAGAVMLRDGRIAVLDRQSALIRVYSPDGEHIDVFRCPPQSGSPWQGASPLPVRPVPWGHARVPAFAVETRAARRAWASPSPPRPPRGPRPRSPTGPHRPPAGPRRCTSVRAEAAGRGAGWASASAPSPAAARSRASRPRA